MNAALLNLSTAFDSLLILKSLPLIPFWFPKVRKSLCLAQSFLVSFNNLKSS